MQNDKFWDKFRDTFRQKPLRAAAIALVCLHPASSFAQSESRTFFASKIYDDRPQLCVAVGTGCGKKAADTLCQQVGYQNAMSFRTVWNKRLVQREQLVGAGALCPHDACSGFQFVKCWRDSQK